jgi:phosphatidylglycerophosphatase A
LKLFWEKLAIFISTGVYTGYFPFAPGTIGTLVAIPLVLLLSFFSQLTYGSATLVIFLIGVWSSGKAELIFQRKDAPPIVIDEIVGFLITMFYLPKGLKYIILGFFLFRFFDIVKPYPANFMNEQVKGGWGVVLDDVFAGIYANISIQVIRLLFSLYQSGKV